MYTLRLNVITGVLSVEGPSPDYCYTVPAGAWMDDIEFGERGGGMRARTHTRHTTRRLFWHGAKHSPVTGARQATRGGGRAKRRRSCDFSSYLFFFFFFFLFFLFFLVLFVFAAHRPFTTRYR